LGVMIVVIKKLGNVVLYRDNAFPNSSAMLCYAVICSVVYPRYA